jgi:hypothetical protein
MIVISVIFFLEEHIIYVHVQFTGYNLKVCIRTSEEFHIPGLYHFI